MANNVKVTISGENTAGPAFNQAKQQLDGLQRGAESLKTALGAIGLGAIASELLQFGKHALEAEADLVRMSQKVGIGVESLSGLAFAAKLGGLGAEQFGVALAKFNKNLTESADGSGKAAKAFEALFGAGWANQLKGKSPEEALRMVAQRLSEVKDNAAKTTVEMELFGRSGGNLADTLNHLGEYLAKAKAAGAIIDPKEAQAAHELEQQILMLEEGANAAARAFLSGLIPSLQKLGKELAGVGTGKTSWQEAGAGFGWLLESLATLRDGLDKTIDRFRILLAQLDAVRSTKGWSDPLGLGMSDKMAAGLAGEQAAANDYANSLRQRWGWAAGPGGAPIGPLPSHGRGYTPPTGGGDTLTWPGAPAALPMHTPGMDWAAARGITVEELQKENQEWALNLTMVSESQKAWGGLVPLLTAGSAAFKEQDKTLTDAAAKMTEDTRTTEENYQIKLQQIEVLERLGEITSETAARARDQAKEARDAADGTLQAWKKAMHELGQDARQFGSALSSTFENAVVNMDFGLNTLVSILQDIERAMWRAFVTTPMENWFAALAKNAGSSGGFFSSLLGAFGLGGGSSAAGMAFDPGAGFAWSFASGGDYGIGPRVTGEDGPELDFPGHQGRVVSNPEIRAALGAGGGGNTYNYSIDARGATAGERERMLAALAATENRAVARSVNAIAQINRRA